MPCPGTNHQKSRSRTKPPPTCSTWGQSKSLTPRPKRSCAWTQRLEKSFGCLGPSAAPAVRTGPREPPGCWRFLCGGRRSGAICELPRGPTESPSGIEVEDRNGSDEGMIPQRQEWKPRSRRVFRGGATRIDYFSR
jgi:hypothetical protein